ncbi:hypothetical protein BGZ82_005434 [Podila clonocystis]|nr:hypothetical protein BGZ82_005434 [Podila clonocystis]
MMINASTVGSRANSGYSTGSDSLDLSHSVGSGLGRATYVNGKMVELGIHGNGHLPQGPSNSLYTHSNYTVQDFMSYQQQQQQQFLEQQQYEYQQMLLLQQQQQQLKQQYQQQQMLLLQQQQKLQSAQIAAPGNRPSQDLTSQITGVVLQTKTRRPARHPDRVANGNSHRSNITHSIAIPSNNSNGSSPSLHRQGHAVNSPSSQRVASSSHRSPTLSNSQAIQYGSSPPGSMASSYTTNGASSFSSTGSHFHTMLAMTSASPPSSSSSSLSNVDSNQGNVHYHQSQHQQQHPSPSSSGTALPSVSAGGGQTKGSSTTHKSGLTIEELAAKILPPRRVLGGREYYPDKTLPYLLPCDEQESERLLLQHYVMRYAFGSNVIPPIDTTIAGKVLDCGCGPGTWIMEMATEFEDLDFYGFDISPMYPSAIHPKNAHFSMANLLDPEIPFASERYLLVHQRNMLLGLTQDAWPGVVQDLFRCVIPGGSGWLQLSEVDPIWCRPGPVSRSVLKMLNETAQNRNVDVLLPQRLDQVLKDVGCEQVKMMMVEIPIGPWGGKIGVLWRDVLKAEMEALKPVVLQAALENAVAAGADIAVCGAEMTTAEEWDEMMASTSEANTPNALEIPEVLLQIGRFLPFWKRAAYHLAQGWVLDPSHWYACILVSRLWYMTLSPLIFHDMDDSSFQRIPLQILLENTRFVQRLHLRLFKPTQELPSSSATIMAAGMTTANIITEFTQLRELELMQSVAWTSQLIQRNPALEKLSWKGGDFHRDDYQRLDYDTLIRLHQLKTLKLDCWTITDAGEFLEILENNQSTLRFLALEFCKGAISVTAKSAMSTLSSSLGSLESLSPPPTFSSLSPPSSYKSHLSPSTYKSLGEISPPMLQLLCLTKLSICKDVDSGPMEDLVRLCPNLQSLSWTGPDDRDLRRLIRNLKMSPSKVSILTYSVIELTEPEPVYADLIKCFSGLTELQIKVPALAIAHLMYGFTGTTIIATSNAPIVTRTPVRRMTIAGSSTNSEVTPQIVGFTEALLGHVNSLQILDLRIKEPKTVESSNVLRILTSCRCLRALSIEGSNCKVLDLCKIQSPWRCMRLRRLNLSGLHVTTKGSASDKDNAQLARQHGWRSEDDERQDSAKDNGGGAGEEEGDGSDSDEEMTRYRQSISLRAKVSSDFLSRLLNHLERLQEMRFLSLNGVQFTRIQPSAQ